MFLTDSSHFALFWDCSPSLNVFFVYKNFVPWKGISRTFLFFQEQLHKAIDLKKSSFWWLWRAAGYWKWKIFVVRYRYTWKDVYRSLLFHRWLWAIIYQQRRIWSVFRGLQNKNCHSISKLIKMCVWCRQNSNFYLVFHEFRSQIYRMIHAKHRFLTAYMSFYHFYFFWCKPHWVVCLNYQACLVAYATHRRWSHREVRWQECIAMGH